MWILLLGILQLGSTEAQLSSAIDLGGEELFISVLEPKPVLDPACSLQNDGALLGSITELKEGQQYKGCFNGTIQSVQIKGLPTAPLVFANSSIENPGDVLFQELSSRCHNSHSLAKKLVSLLDKRLSKVNECYSSTSKLASLSSTIDKLENEILTKENVVVCGFKNILDLIPDISLVKCLLANIPKEYNQAYQEEASLESEISPVLSRQKRVIGGSPATSTQVPWHAHIVIDGFFDTTLCSGVLVHSCYVLTHKRCLSTFTTLSNTKVILGDITRNIVDLGQVTKNILYIHYHPNPEIEVAMILLESSSYTSYGRPATLGSGFPFGTGSVAGFGSTSCGFPNLSNQLLIASNTIVSSSTCENYWASAFGLTAPVLADHEFCAGNNALPYRGPGAFDQGSGLVTSTGRLLGIVSRTVAFSCNVKYAVYINTNYPAIKGWIESILPSPLNANNQRCACRRQSVQATGSLTSPYPFGPLSNRNCALRLVPSSCGSSSPNFAQGFYSSQTNTIQTARVSRYTCWSKASALFLKDCGRQFPYLGKMYIKTWNSFDCPLSLDSIPEETQAFTSDCNIIFGLSWNLHFYTYPLQTNTFDYSVLLDSCFSGSSVVQLENNNKIQIRDLRIGDELKATNPDGSMISTSFLGWLHKEEDQPAMFVRFVTDSGRELSLTPHHLILSTKIKTEKLEMKFAHQVSLEDYLLNDEGVLDKVVAIDVTEENGFYAPLTDAGVLNVNGLVASCYAHILDQKLAHATMLPVRMFPTLLESEATQAKNGLRTYPKILMNLVSYLKKSPEEGTLIENLIAGNVLGSVASGIGSMMNSINLVK